MEVKLKTLIGFRWVMNGLKSNASSYPVIFDPFLISVTILCPLKTPEKTIFSGGIKWEHWPDVG